MEIWDLYDINRNKIGKTHQRGIEIPEGCFHLVVRAWVKNDKDEVLLSKRHPHKPFGGFWENTGGSAIQGENSLQAVLREVSEEIGLQLIPEDGKLILQQTKNISHQDIWLFRSNVAIDELSFQEDEVVDAMWVDKGKYYDMQNEGLIVPTISVFSAWEDKPYI
ncbi:NUDIX hydrolase [Oceanobacillus kimchii]|uniref:8-oxo-dGTP diphosphatase n=1 Tax=Oceanobacillus kimchii TaxID=746691 RepID=A0ABQ5TFH3_9BACI|nr:NUDIX domain-containing protein [Oceanobacillus kimchii]GLO64710.1 NUDIX hydrolase [Oceanobacillus kimchii]